VDFTVSIPVDELARIHRLIAMFDQDERHPGRRVHLRGNGQRREWWAESELNLVRLNGEDDDRRYEIGIPQVIVQNIALLAADDSEVELLVQEYAEGQHQIGLRSSIGTIWAQDSTTECPYEARFVEIDEPVAARAVVKGDTLQRVVAAARTQRVRPEDEEKSTIGTPSLVIGISAEKNEVMFDALWEGIGTTVLTAEPSSIDGVAMRRIDSNYVQSAVYVFDDEDDVEIVIPDDIVSPIHFTGGDWSIRMITLKTGEQILRDNVERLLGECFGSLAVVRDHDGDYPLQRSSVSVYARLVHDDDTTVLQVFAVVVDDVDSSPALMQELNDQNQGLSFTRIFHAHEQVLAEADLVASSVDRVELETAVRRITRVAASIGPVIAAVFGGTPAQDPAEARWQDYRTTVVSAEVAPGSMFDLNGAAALDKWPFPGTVYVLTGWNPQGAQLGAETQEEINSRIAMDILRHGGRFVHGEGRSPDGEHAEPSLIAWNLSREEAVLMGRKARQDAIFEIDDTSFTLVSCVDEREETFSRRSWR